MPSLDAYRRILQSTDFGIIDSRRNTANTIMESTWYSDIDTRRCYIYDFFHDGESLKCKGYRPEIDKKKIAIDAKFSTVKYNSILQSQVEHHLQFKPSEQHEIPYYKNAFGDRYGAEYPVGLYVDIPDSRGIYRKWIICGHDFNSQFVKYVILPCNYLYRWVYNNKTYEMWGINRTSNSYNSGVWRDHYTQTAENQKKMILPQNEISELLYYDQRMIISAPMAEPITWTITKVENDSPLGINKITLAQDKFNPKTDFVDLKTGIMYANYYGNKLGITPNDDIPDDKTKKPACEIVFKGTFQKIKIRGSAKPMTANFHDAKGNLLTDVIPEWEFLIDGEDVSDLLNIEYGADGWLKVGIDNDELFGKVLTVRASSEDGDTVGEKEFEIEGL